MKKTLCVVVLVLPRVALAQASPPDETAGQTVLVNLAQEVRELRTALVVQQQQIQELQKQLQGRDAVLEKILQQIELLKGGKAAANAADSLSDNGRQNSPAYASSNTPPEMAENRPTSPAEKHAAAGPTGSSLAEDSGKPTGGASETVPERTISALGSPASAAPATAQAVNPGRAAQGPEEQPSQEKLRLGATIFGDYAYYFRL